MHGMTKVEELYACKLKDVSIEDNNETFENKQLKFIFNKLKLVHDVAQMDETTLRYDIELRRWGHEHEVIPKKMLNSPLVSNIFLKNNTFFNKN